MKNFFRELIFFFTVKTEIITLWSFCNENNNAVTVTWEKQVSISCSRLKAEPFKAN